MHVSRHSAAAVFVSDNGGGAFGAHAVAGGRLPSFSTEFFFSLSLSLWSALLFLSNCRRSQSGGRWPAPAAFSLLAVDEYSAHV